MSGRVVLKIQYLAFGSAIFYSIRANVYSITPNSRHIIPSPKMAAISCIKAVVLDKEGHGTQLVLVLLISLETFSLPGNWQIFVSAASFSRWLSITNKTWLSTSEYKKKRLNIRQTGLKESTEIFVLETLKKKLKTIRSNIEVD